MALPMLVGGSECGPSNGLKDLTKRFDKDLGAQQDFFGAGRAGSSREAFRSQSATNHGPDQDAARFFSTNTPAPQLESDAAFDVGALRAALPATQGPAFHAPQVHMQPTNQASAWAADFLQQPTTSSTPFVGFKQEQAPSQMQAQPVAVAPSMPLQQLPWNPAMPTYRMNNVPAFMPQLHAQQQPVASKRISWDKEFSAQELNFASQSTTVDNVVQQENVADSSRNQFEGDDLARTAGLLLEHVKHEQNPKFQQSQFLGLMRQLRDGEVIVEGNKMVESDGTRTSASASVDVKGKGRAIDPVAGLNTPSFSQFGQPIHQANSQQVAEQNRIVEEDPNDAYFRQENEDYIRYWKEGSDVEHFHIPEAANVETAAWNKLQEDWERFEATSTRIKQIPRYQFQENNPYLLGESSRTRHHLIHTEARQSVLESVLELEAAVQRDVSNAAAWYELGVKQQENEREHKALQALQRAVGLDPSYLPAWLALAISYTNDNNREGTYDSINEWITRNDKYQEAVRQYRDATPEKPHASMAERFSYLIQCLIAMARSNANTEIDADIQIALAVLLNTNEEYEKAQDCFRTALAVRPDDWLLYNRVGATMANSGRAEEALQYYYKALELHPGYIRARFNLGISCINLRRYEEAAEHILNALLFQDSDTIAESGGSDKGDNLSSALWDSLKTTCLHLQRADLATLCDLKDLDGFRKRFHG